MPLQIYIHSTLLGDWAKELSKPSKDAASLLVCIFLNVKFWIWVFWGWQHKWSKFYAILTRLLHPRCQPLEGIYWLKFLWEIKLKESFKPLIDFLAFVIQSYGKIPKIWVEILFG